jgi:hypothetical protein
VRRRDDAGARALSRLPIAQHSVPPTETGGALSRMDVVVDVATVVCVTLSDALHVRMCLSDVLAHV